MLSLREEEEGPHRRHHLSVGVSSTRGTRGLHTFTQFVLLNFEVIVDIDIDDDDNQSRTIHPLALPTILVEEQRDSHN